MSLYALPVTSSDLTQLQDGIQFFTDNAQAQSQTNLINNNQGTVFSYANTLLANAVSTSQVAMADFAYALGKTDTVAHLNGIVDNFLPPQVKFAVDQNLAGGPTVYAAQVYALALATSFSRLRDVSRYPGQGRHFCHQHCEPNRHERLGNSEFLRCLVGLLYREPHCRPRPDRDGRGCGLGLGRRDGRGARQGPERHRSWH